nr:hypothetical protein HannXRQ_Chr01g0009631 [Ipomoea batatas]GMC54345.1 hypothetical protein HannXRQ_Chr01g0009631 [Ipomoea batatas]GMC55146.1 hypothetical protein HannXRQ_Chr01g0009631 [Ipomoea batatas]
MDGSSYFLMTLSANVSCQNLTKRTGSNNIDGILDRCNCSDSVCPTLLKQRSAFGRNSI